MQPWEPQEPQPRECCRQSDLGPSAETDFDLQGSSHHSLKSQSQEGVSDWRRLYFTCAYQLSGQEMLGKHWVSLGLHGDGAMGGGC